MDEIFKLILVQLKWPSSWGLLCVIHIKPFVIQLFALDVLIYRYISISVMIASNETVPVPVPDGVIRWD